MHCVLSCCLLTSTVHHRFHFPSSYLAHLTRLTKSLRSVSAVVCVCAILVDCKCREVLSDLFVSFSTLISTTNNHLNIKACLVPVQSKLYSHNKTNKCIYVRCVFHLLFPHQHVSITDVIKTSYICTFVCHVRLVM